MGNDSRYDAPQLNQTTTTVIDEIMVLANSGRWNQLEIKAQALATCHPGQIMGWVALSKALLKLGKWTQAVAALSQVIKLSTNDADAHNDLGYVFANLGREEEAEASYRRALQCNSKLAKAHNNLGALLVDQGRLAEAAVNLRQSLEINPKSDYALHCLGSLLDRVGGNDGEAVSCLERSLALNPDNATACNTLGNILIRTGQKAKSIDMFRSVLQAVALITRHARKEQADFSALLLYAPGPGCTPVDYLLRKAPYDCHFYCVLPDAPHNLDLLRAKADVVVNLIADADNGTGVLPFAQDLVEQLGRPIFNHPCLIMNTGRDVVAKRIAGIPLCRIPRSVRLAGPGLAKAAQNKSLDGVAMPLLARVAGNHGGDDFEKLDDLNAIAEFVSKRLEADYYLTEYVDYRSADGFFRKYRLISIDGELLPYHLAIHDDWKVHHFRTDMANQSWMRQEEETFLKAPHLIFDEPHQAALRAVAAATGLDYCGIDCAIGRDGAIVIFESNAAMLVHGENDEIFAYKNSYVAKIKDAFDAKLTRLAASSLAK